MSFTVLFSQPFVCDGRLYADCFFIESFFSIAMFLSFSLPISCKRYGPSFMNTDRYLYKILYGLVFLEFLFIDSYDPHDIGRIDIAAMQNTKGVCL